MHRAGSRGTQDRSLDRPTNKSAATKAGRTVAANDWDQLKAMMLPAGFGAAGSSSGARKRPRSDLPTPVISNSSSSSAAAAPDTPPASSLAPGSMGDDDAPLTTDRNDQDDGKSPADAAPSFSQVPQLPLASEVHLRGHAKPATCLDVDPAGNRVIAGSADYLAKLWDFGGMSAEGRPFKSIEPVSGHQVVDVQWSISGDGFLVATHGLEPRLYTRDGGFVKEFTKGDMYIRDPRHTDGHTAPVTCLRWHPSDKLLFATASYDSTIRIWSTANSRKNKNVIVFKHGTGARGSAAKTTVTAIAYSTNAEYLAAGGADGSVRVWRAAPPYTVPVTEIPAAHVGAVAAMVFTADAGVLLTRGAEDGCVCRWEIEAPSPSGGRGKPRPTVTKPTVRYSDAPVGVLVGANLAMSPEDDWVALGSEHLTSSSSSEPAPETTASAGKSQPPTAGRITVLSSTTLKPMDHVLLDAELGPAGSVAWCPRTNQIFATTHSGTVVALYDAAVSSRGVMASATRAPKTKRASGDMDEELQMLLLERAADQLASAAAAQAGSGKRNGGGASRALMIQGGRISKKQIEMARGEAKPVARTA
ncbi:WD40-repeat-containing domain protein, partial [Blastocladiella britannica]